MSVNYREEQQDQILKDLTLAISEENMAQVNQLLDGMTQQHADEVVILFQRILTDAKEGESGSKAFLENFFTSNPLKGKTLAKAILGCLRKEPTEGTLPLAKTLLAKSGESKETVSQEIKGMSEEVDYPSDQFDKLFDKGDTQEDQQHQQQETEQAAQEQHKQVEQQQEMGQTTETEQTAAQ